MGRVEKISIALTPEMAEMMRRMVDSGEYASVSEVMREALRDWRQRRAERERAIEELGRLWDDGLASGPSFPGAEGFARVRDRLNRTADGAA